GNIFHPAGMRDIERICSEPVAVGYTPEIIVVRAGAQTGAFDHALLYRQPRAAKRSRLGVMEYSSPQAWRCGPVSSQVSQRIFGLADCARRMNGAAAAAPRTLRRGIM